MPTRPRTSGSKMADSFVRFKAAYKARYIGINSMLLRMYNRSRLSSPISQFRSNKAKKPTALAGGGQMEKTTSWIIIISNWAIPAAAPTLYNKFHWVSDGSESEAFLMDGAILTLKISSLNFTCRYRKRLPKRG